MPALKLTSYRARIVWMGRVTDQKHNLRSESLTEAMLTFDGISGEMHGGAKRASCSRVTTLYPKGTQIRNVRQLTIVSQEELDLIAHDMGADRLDPALLGASMVIEGIPAFTHVPPSSRLQGPSGACLTIDMENRPCTLLARDIAKDHGPLGKAFKPAAKGRRGVTAWVECGGMLRVNDELALHVPDQPVWDHLEDARQ